jgi:hypothetical protein
LSFTKGFLSKKRKPGKGSDDSEPPVTNQMSTFNSENQRLDPGAYTELKTASAKKKADPYGRGFVKALKDMGPTDSNPLRLYPGPEQPWNVSGSDKVAGVTAPLKAPTSPGAGAAQAFKPMSAPKRVTPNMGAYGAPKGASGVFGKSVTAPFAQSYGKFGRRPRQAIKSITRLHRGM